MKCEIREIEMKWVETGVHGGGYWFCQQCHDEEKERLEAWADGVQEDD